MTKLAAITGCDSGIGASLCKIFSSNGYKVIISYLGQNPFQTDARVVARRLDLQNEKQIISFAKLIRDHCDKGYRLDYFINNAGVAMGGPFENIPLEIFRKVYEVNFFGLISITQKILPCLVSSKGRLVVNGSLAGRIAPSLPVSLCIDKIRA